MKKVNLQSIVWALLITASAASYTYLNFVACEPQGVCTTTSAGEADNHENEDTKAILPDIALMKKILNVTKIVYPKD